MGNKLAIQSPDHYQAVCQQLRLDKAQIDQIEEERKDLKADALRTCQKIDAKAKAAKAPYEERRKIADRAICGWLEKQRDAEVKQQLAAAKIPSENLQEALIVASESWKPPRAEGVTIAQSWEVESGDVDLAELVLTGELPMRFVILSLDKKAIVAAYKAGEFDPPEGITVTSRLATRVKGATNDA